MDAKLILASARQILSSANSYIWGCWEIYGVYLVLERKERRVKC